MDAAGLIQQIREAIGGRLVYAEPVERDGVAVIPAARVRAGGGGGGGWGNEDGNGRGNGGGGGGGLIAVPAGAWVIQGGNVRWQPAIDPVRIAAIAAATLIVLSFRRRKRPAT